MNRISSESDQFTEETSRQRETSHVSASMFFSGSKNESMQLFVPTTRKNQQLVTDEFKMNSGSFITDATKYDNNKDETFVIKT